METGEIDEQIAVYRGEALVLVAPLLVVPTELTYKRTMNNRTPTSPIITMT